MSAIKLELLGQEVDVGTLAPGERWKGRLGAHRGPAIISWSAGDIRQTSLHHEDADMDDFPWSVLDIHLYPTTAFWETD